MTEQTPDTLALRLIMSLLNDDFDMTNSALTAITAAVDADREKLSKICMALGVRSLSALMALNNRTGDPDFALRMVQSWLQEELDGDGSEVN